MSTKALLSEAIYALGEAIVNSQIALDLEDRPHAKVMIEEDIIYFYGFKKRLEEKIINLEQQKRFSKEEA